jgi:hypothetical protein
MANRRKPASQKVRATGISLPPDLLKKAQRFAFKQDMSLSALIRELLITQLAAK